jgi:hypothetical protein
MLEQVLNGVVISEGHYHFFFGVREKFHSVFTYGVLSVNDLFADKLFNFFDDNFLLISLRLINI